MQRGINELCLSFLGVSTSQFVVDEFEASIGGLYDAVVAALRRLPGQSKLRPFEDMWKGVLYLLPAYMPGGAKQLSQLGTMLGVRYGQREVAPIEIANFLCGQKIALLEMVFIIAGIDIRSSGTLLDNSSCCMWSKERDSMCTMDPSPSCCLKLICVDKRVTFLSALLTLANSSREEGRWLRDRVGVINNLDALSLMSLVTKHPGPFGDLIIFCEVPDGWSILTRDKTFLLLAKVHRDDLSVYQVRLPRITSGDECLIAPMTANIVWIRARLENWTILDVCVVLDKKLGKVNDRVLVSANEIGESREGKITRIEQVEETFHHGIRFLTSAPSHNR